MPRCGETLIDLAAHRAINAARYAQPRGGSRTGRQPRSLWVYTDRSGLLVKPFRPRRMFATPQGYRAKYSHLTRWGWKATDPTTGRVRLTVVRFLCGQTSPHALLSNEAELSVCPKCLMVAIGPEEAVKRLERSREDECASFGATVSSGSDRPPAARRVEPAPAVRARG